MANEELDNLPLAPTLAPSLPAGPVDPNRPSLATGQGGQSQFATPDTGGQAPSQVQLPPREPGTSIASQQQPSRADFFRKMLGDFFYAAGTGLANAGHGPGSFGRGLGAGLTALPQRDVLQQQLEIQRTQAQGMQEYRKAQAESLTPSIRMKDPDGNEVLIPPAHVTQALASQYRFAGTEATVAGREKVANINRAGRMDVEEMKAMLQAGQMSRLVPDIGADKKPFYHVINKFGRDIGTLDVSAIPQLMQRTSNTTEWRDNGQGEFIPLPKTTVSGPSIAGLAGAGMGTGTMPAQGAVPARPAGAPAARPTAPSSNVMMVGSMPDGTQVAGTPAELKGAGVNNFTKAGQTMATQITQARNLVTKGGLFDAVEKDLAQFTPEELNGIGNRWQEFRLGSWIPQLLTGKGADPRYVKLRTDLNGLESTAVMQVHVGQRGGQYMGEHFEDLANAKKFTLDNLKTAVGQERQYIEHRAMRVPEGSSPSKTAPKAGVIQYDSNGNRM